MRSETLARRRDSHWIQSRFWTTKYGLFELETKVSFTSLPGKLGSLHKLPRQVDKLSKSSQLPDAKVLTQRKHRQHIHTRADQRTHGVLPVVGGKLRVGAERNRALLRDYRARSAHEKHDERRRAAHSRRRVRRLDR